MFYFWSHLKIHTGRIVPEQITYWNIENSFPLYYFIKPFKILTRKKTFLYSQYLDTDKSGWFNKWINSKPTIHPIIEYWILCLHLTFQYIYILKYIVYIQYALPGLGLRSHGSTKKKRDFSPKWNSAKRLLFYGLFFWWPVKDLDVFFSSPVRKKPKNTKISTIYPSFTLLSLFRIIFHFEIPVLFCFFVFYSFTYASNSRTLSYSASYTSSFCSINGIVC